MHVLIVEDDEVLGDGIQTVLTQRGLTVDWVQDGVSADNRIRTDTHDLVLLDLNLPGLSGLDVLKRLRSGGNNVPVLVLTARSQVSDRVRALDGGADDYLVKPFEIDELCARVRALHRRSRGHVAPTLCVGDLLLDPATHTVKVSGRSVVLSNREFAILRSLMENAGRVQSRRRLEEVGSSWGDELESNAVEVHIHHLRKKLGINPIRTVRGVGYIIEKSGAT